MTSDEGYRAALRWLAARPLTVREVRDRLNRAGVPAADQVVLRLGQEGWLSDDAVADQELRRAQSSRHGPRRLTDRLRRRGVDDDLIRRTLDRWSDEDVYRGALEMARRDPDDPRRLARRLERRGYSSRQIARVLRDLAADGDLVVEDGVEP